MNCKKQPTTNEKTELKIGHGYAHSKIILMGEHAVVYGVPAIAMPFKAATVDVTITPSQSDVNYFISDYFEGNIEDMPDWMANVKEIIALIFNHFNLPEKHLQYKVESNIPIGRGMGSSAAIAVALTRALMDFFNIQLSQKQLHFIVNQAEVIAHETTSGIDTLMASTDLPIMYQKSEEPIPFSLKLKSYLVLADSGIKGQTKVAVSKVKKLYNERPKFVEEAMSTIERFVKLGYQAIKNHDAPELGRMLTYNHYYLNQLEVSHPVIDRMIQAAWYAGALGAKLTGGGLGGCAIALAKSKEDAEKISKAMQLAGAKQTWILNLMEN